MCETKHNFFNIRAHAECSMLGVRCSMLDAQNPKRHNKLHKKTTKDVILNALINAVTFYGLSSVHLNKKLKRKKLKEKIRINIHEWRI